mmetsp:Transcript_4440/g.19909  ORF Transcript_4440/g.19909 Transcript_4440/m.19909 type:complete len:307 (+) Transcript_4440:1830-2750(+)
MELQIGEVDALLVVAPVRRLRVGLSLLANLIVQADDELGHAREERLHLDDPGDGRLEHHPFRRHEQRHGLDDVEVHLVLLVRQVWRAPLHGSGDLHRHLLRLALILVRRRWVIRGAIRSLSDERLQHLRGGDLRVAVVADLVEELVDYDKVGLEHILVELVKVRLEERDEVMHEREGEHGVGVCARHRHHVHVLLPGVHEGAHAEVYHRASASVLAVDDLRLESGGHVAVYVVAVLALQDDVATEVEEVQGAQRDGRITRHALQSTASARHFRRTSHVAGRVFPARASRSREIRGFRPADRSPATP